MVNPTSAYAPQPGGFPQPQQQGGYQPYAPVVSAQPAQMTTQTAPPVAVAQVREPSGNVPRMLLLTGRQGGAYEELDLGSVGVRAGEGLLVLDCWEVRGFRKCRIVEKGEGLRNFRSGI
jgi:hypothetical protein